MLESKPVLILLGMVILIFTWSVLRFWIKMSETGKNKALVQEKTEALREQKETLVTDINKLKTDRGKEEFVRENFGLAKEGEDVIIIVEDEAVKTEPKRGKISGFFAFFADLFK